MRFETACVVLLLAGAASARAEDDAVMRGAAIYARACQQCHGRALAADGPGMFDLKAYGGSFAQFRDTVLNGTGGNMPSQAGNVAEDEIADLYAYVTAEENDR